MDFAASLSPASESKARAPGESRGGEGRVNCTAHPSSISTFRHFLLERQPFHSQGTGSWRLEERKEMALMRGGDARVQVLCHMLGVCRWRIYSLLLRLRFLICKGRGETSISWSCQGFHELITHIKCLPSYLAQSRCSINASRCSHAMDQAMWGAFCILNSWNLQTSQGQYPLEFLFYR